jgi:hypothetical protein
MAKRKTHKEKAGLDKVPPILSRPLWKDGLIRWAIVAILFWLVVAYLLFG